MEGGCTDMKKIMFSLIMITLIIFGGSFVYAASFDDEECTVEITSDLNLEDEKLSTFDDEKTIAGTALSGTIIEISVSSKDFSGKYKQNQFYTIEVGSSEIFNQAMGLKVGKNLVEVTASLDGEIILEGEIVINRKSRLVKQQLEKGIYIPGGNY